MVARYVAPLVWGESLNYNCSPLDTFEWVTPEPSLGAVHAPHGVEEVTDGDQAAFPASGFQVGYPGPLVLANVIGLGSGQPFLAVTAPDCINDAVEVLHSVR